LEQRRLVHLGRPLQRAGLFCDRPYFHAGLLQILPPHGSHAQQVSKVISVLSAVKVLLTRKHHTLSFAQKKHILIRQNLDGIQSTFVKYYFIKQFNILIFIEESVYTNLA
jgi:hypothetical protein